VIVDEVEHSVKLAGTGHESTERVQASQASSESKALEASLRESEAALRESEARFRAIFEKGAIGISLLDLEGHLLVSNPAFQEMLGYSEAELEGMDFAEYTHPADVKSNRDLFQELVAGKREHYRLEKRYLRKDRQMVWGHLTVSLVRDATGKPQFVVGMVKDIAERKQMEAELAEVHRQLMEGREAERLHMAQELHDGPIQELVALSYRLAELWNLLPDEASAGQVVAAQATLHRAVTALRTISHDLRPPVLAPFGLEKAIRSHVEGFGQAHPELEIELDLMADGQELPEPMRLALFRIYQQALNNIVRHAEAHHVLIRLILDAERIVLEIQDDGRGFQMPKRHIVLVRQGHLGLVGMAERAEAIGGSLEIISAPGTGTLIRVVVPRSSAQATIDRKE
jgi:PAS domain S-box-containing protein